MHVETFVLQASLYTSKPTNPVQGRDHVFTSCPSTSVNDSRPSYSMHALRVSSIKKRATPRSSTLTHTSNTTLTHPAHVL